MNQQLSSKTISCGVGLGAMLLSALAASAQTSNSYVTFQIDMTVAIANSQFNPANQTVAARGTFDGWPSPGFALTNDPSGANSNLWSGTYQDTNDANGGLMAWQFVTVSNGAIASYSSQADGHNYCASLPATSGASLILPVVFWDDDGAAVTNNITFQVDMAEQLNIGVFNTNVSVFCQGSFEGWNDNFQLSNNAALNQTNSQGIFTSLPYQGTYAWIASPGAMANFKYVTNNELLVNGSGNQYENVSAANGDLASGNRFFMNEPQVMPLVWWGDKAFSLTVTNNVTFECDMTALILSGGFDTNGGTVQLRGDFNNWNGQPMSNNSASSTPNIYSALVTFVDAAGAAHDYKFWENGTYESGNNRVFDLLQSNGNFTVGPYYFNNQLPISFDYVTISNCTVTFTVNMSNAVGNEGYVFGTDVNGPDTVYLNGLYNGDNNDFYGWGTYPIQGGAAGYQMTNIPSTTLYTITLPVNQGQSADLIYKYSINGWDDEAGFNDNHERWVRSQPTNGVVPSYTMPVDTFGSQGATTQTEISFGDLTITKLDPVTLASIQLSWLGRGGVHLQTTSDLSAGTNWTNLYLTDGTNLLVAPGGTATTNYTIGPGSMFYRLIGPE